MLIKIRRIKKNIDYIYLPPDQIKKQDAKKLIYVKSPYKFTKEEIETLDIYIHLVQLFNTSSE